MIAEDETRKVTRFEVINHTRPTNKVIIGDPRTNQRVLVTHDIKVTLMLQDDGRTLKVFLDDRSDE